MHQLGPIILYTVVCLNVRGAFISDQKRSRRTLPQTMESDSPYTVYMDFEKSCTTSNAYSVIIKRAVCPPLHPYMSLEATAIQRTTWRGWPAVLNLGRFWPFSQAFLHFKTKTAEKYIFGKLRTRATLFTRVVVGHVKKADISREVVTRNPRLRVGNPSRPNPRLRTRCTALATQSRCTTASSSHASSRCSGAVGRRCGWKAGVAI